MVSPGPGAAVASSESPWGCIVAGTAACFMGFEPVVVTGRPTTHPDALRARIGSCRDPQTKRPRRLSEREGAMFYGLDVHKRFIQVCEVDHAGHTRREDSIEELFSLGERAVVVGLKT